MTNIEVAPPILDQSQLLADFPKTKLELSWHASTVRRLTEISEAASGKQRYVKISRMAAAVIAAYPKVDAASFQAVLTRRRLQPFNPHNKREKVQFKWPVPILAKVAEIESNGDSMGDVTDRTEVTAAIIESYEEPNHKQLTELLRWYDQATVENIMSPPRHHRWEQFDIPA